MENIVTSIWEVFLPVVSMILVTVLVPAVVAVSTKMFQKLGVDISAEQRNTYQSALENAAGVLVQRLGPKAATMTHLADHLTNKAVSDAIDRVQKGAPDGIAAFGISETDIARGIEAKLGQLTGVTDAEGAPVVSDVPPTTATAIARSPARE